MTVTVRPQAGPVREYAFPKFTRRTLSNGVQLILAPMHKVPLVTVLAVVDAGAVGDPHGKEGVAELTATALTEGAGSFEGEALTDYLERLGTSVGASADWDEATIKMTVLEHKLPDAFARFADVLTAPTFPQSAIDRLKGERLTEIQHIESEPRSYASEKFQEFLYAEGARYAAPVGGTKETVPSLSRQDVIEFYKSRYRPKNTTIIIAGDITIEGAQTVVEGALKNWTGDKPPEIVAVDTPKTTARMLHLVPRSDAPQSELRIGHVGVPRTHKDYFDITVMNAILGGLFGSRVNLNLREEHGYTYGASSGYDWRRNAGPFVISTAVASNVTAEAIKETLHEVDRMRTEEVTDDELSLATKYLDGVFPIRFETTSSVAGALAAIVIYGLPDNWYDTYRANIRAITPQRVLNAAKNHISPDSLQIVIVGNANEIKESLEVASFAPITIHV